MSIGFPQSIINSQIDPTTLSAYPIINIRDVDLSEVVSASLTAHINESDIIVLQKKSPADSANVVSLTVSGLRQVIGSSSTPIDWSNVSATGTFKGDGSGLTGIVAGAGTYLPLSGGVLTGPVTGTFKGNGSSLTGIGHNSLTGLLANDHPQYALTSSLSSYALTSSLSSYALTSSLSSYSLTSHIHNYLPLSGGIVTGLTKFTSGLTSSYGAFGNGDYETPTIYFASGDGNTGLYRVGLFGIGMCADRESIVTFERNSISSNNANLYIKDIYADEIFGTSLSARVTTYTPSIYTNTFYYRTANNVEFNCENSYYYIFNGLGGAYFEGGLSSASNSYFAGLSANTLSGNGAALTNVSGTDVTYYNYRQDSFEPTGFSRQDRFNSRLSLTASSKTFEIAPTGTSYSFWCSGNRFTKTTSETITWPAASGNHHFYFDETGTLKTTQTFSLDLIRKYAYIGNTYWDNLSSSAIGLGDERHGMIMDSATHEYLHETIGAQYVSGLQIGNIVVGGSTISVSNGTFYDEDLLHTITNGSSQTLSTTAYIPVYSMTGNKLWQKTVATAYPWKSGASRLNFNEYVAGTSAWQQTQVTADNDYVLSHIVATHDVNEPIICIQGQAQYTTGTLARAGAVTEISNLITDGLPLVESVILATIIFQTNSAWSAGTKGRIVSPTSPTVSTHINWTTTTISQGSPPSSHSNLTNLGADDHAQYVLLNGTRTGNIGLSGNLTVTGNIDVNVLNIKNAVSLTSASLSTDTAAYLHIRPQGAYSYFDTLGVNNYIILQDYTGSNRFAQFAGDFFRFRDNLIDKVFFSTDAYSYINNGQNFGIGSSSDLGFKLAVTGSIYGKSITSDSISAADIYTNTIHNTYGNGHIYFGSDGFVGVGTDATPNYIFHVASAGIVRNYIESTDSGQASTDLRSGTKHSRTICDSSYIWRLYDQTTGRAVNLITVDHTGIGKFLGPSFTITGSLSAQSISSSNVSLTGIFKGDGSGLTGITDLDSYLPLTGGTLTGPLTGKSAYFNSYNSSLTSSNKSKLLSLSGTWLNESDIPSTFASNNSPVEISNSYSFNIGSKSIYGNSFYNDFSTLSGVPSGSMFGGANFYTKSSNLGAGYTSLGVYDPLDMSIYAYLEGFGSAGSFNQAVNNDYFITRPDTCGAKALFSQSINTGSGSCVGYFGYGNSQNAAGTGTAVGVLGLANAVVDVDTETQRAWTIGVLGLVYTSIPLGSTTWGVYSGNGHMGVHNGSLFVCALSSGASSYHPTTLVARNTPTKFGYTNEGCLYVSNTAEVKSLLHCQNLITAPSISADSIQSNTLSATTYGIVYTNTINGKDSGDITITPVGGNTNIYYLYGMRSITASEGLQTNLIYPITDSDSLSITSNGFLDLYATKDISLESVQSINMDAAGVIITAPTTNFNGNIRITGSLSATDTISGSINSNAGFILENRTSDPATPAVGRIWFRTDL